MPSARAVSRKTERRREVSAFARESISRLVRDPREAVRRLADDTEVALDLETSGLSPWKDRIGVVTLNGQQSNTTAVLHVRGVIPDYLRKFLSDPKRRFTTHNGTAFDLLFLSTHGVDVGRPRHYDTLTGESAVLMTARRDVSKALDKTIERRLGVKIDKSIEHGHWMDPELSEEQLDYVTGDIVYLHALRQAQEEQAASNGLTSALGLEMDILPAVLQMTIHGLPIDLGELDRYLAIQDGIIRSEQDYLLEQLGPISLTSPVQVKAALNRVGVNVHSTAAPVLADMALLGGDDVPVLRSLLAHRHASQRRKMYSPGWVASFVHEGRVHPRFRSCGADTGRFTCADPNAQQIPRDARWVFRAAAGHKIVNVDYSQLEVRVAAALAGDELLLSMLKESDIYRMIGSEVFGCTPAELSDAQRKLTKAMAFTLLFGGGARTFFTYARLNGSALTLDQARSIVRRFFDRFRGLARVRDKAQRLADRGGPIFLTITEGGLKRMLVGGDVTATRILNTTVQGTAATGLKRGILRAYRAGLSEHLGATVHDELVGDPWASQAQEFRMELERCMLAGMEEVVDAPLAVEGHVADAWGEPPKDELFTREA